MGEWISRSMKRSDEAHRLINRGIGTIRNVEIEADPLYLPIVRMIRTSLMIGTTIEVAVEVHSSEVLTNP